MKTKSKEVVASNAWWCETCGAKEEMTHPEMIAHLKETHGLESKGLKCRRQMLMHVDGDTWFTSQYLVTIETPGGELKLTNSTMNPRESDDPMRYA